MSKTAATWKKRIAQWPASGEMAERSAEGAGSPARPSSLCRGSGRSRLKLTERCWSPAPWFLAVVGSGLGAGAPLGLDLLAAAITGAAGAIGLFTGRSG